MDEAPGWTLEELVRRVGLALDGAARVGAYPGAPNGRVRDVPDQRVIRWYTSTGLVDRPIGGRGRGARYGTRHLNQLMAIKRLQAVGSSLAEIQLRLAGADDATLAGLADLPAEPAAPVAPGGTGGTGGPAVREPRQVAQQVSAVRRTARFWTTPPAHTSPVHAAPMYALADAAAEIDVRPDRVEHDRVEADVLPVAALKLSGGAMLLLPGLPGLPGSPGSPGLAGLTAADLSALAEAARPLLAALAERGLIAAPTPASSSGSASPAEPADHHDQTARPSREGAHS